MFLSTLVITFTSLQFYTRIYILGEMAYLGHWYIPKYTVGLNEYC